LGCANFTTAALRLQCIRSKNWTEIFSVAFPNTGPVLATNAWFPVVDGVELLENAELLVRAGKYNKVPILMGSNQNDGGIIFDYPNAIDAVTYTPI